VTQQITSGGISIMINAIIGGTLIGVASVWLWLSLGRVAGISGIAAQALTNPRNALWALMFVVGLGAGGWAALGLTTPSEPTALSATQIALFAGAGLLVGFGTRLGSGCTSGHGVCGNARLSKRSLSATITFLAVGMITATLVHAS
jgi:uncharacterized membrane protein YedE/YeeE